MEHKLITKSNQNNSGEALTLDTKSLKATDFDPADKSKGTQYKNIPNVAKYDKGEWDYENAVYLSGLLSSEKNKGGINDQQGGLRDFLALYNVSQEDRTEWLTPKLVNGGTKTAAQIKYLFGSVEDKNGLIPQVHIGGTGGANPYRNMNAILKSLGIKSSPVASHETHFHVYFSPPAAKEIDDPKKMITPSFYEGNQAIYSAISSSNLQSAESLIDYAKTLTEGDVEMIFNAEVPFVQMQNASSLQTAPAKTLRAIEYVECRDVGNQAYHDGAAVNNFVIGGAVFTALGYKFNPKGFDYLIPDKVRFQTKYYVVTAPKHGEVYQSEEDKKHWLYSYRSVEGYTGQDSFTIGVDTFSRSGKEVHFKLKFNLAVMEELGNEPQLCESMKFSSLPNSPVSISWDLPIPVNFAHLGSALLGETIGLGPTAQITLDTDAAGHGWYIDDTPDNNDEFLPTADPEVWIAKAGTAAAGKMDMLSVLLHEYGHALGIEHNGDNADYMAASLQPGQRRLPSTEELSLMGRLVAALKGGTDADPNSPMNPNLPISSLGLMALCRIRRADYGWTLGVDKAQLVSRVDVNNLLQNANQPAQLQTVVNSTLNQDSSAWQTTGNIGNTNGSITLAESATSNTHLSQSFAVKQGDRYLSFTVANDHLQSNGVDEDGNGNGPNDAFEVALLNANTGLSVAGTTGLSRSDALLNIQTDGTQSRAASVRKVHNADGSDTYYVDLQQAVNESNGLVTGTPVTLSFDLMGFGTQSSQVSLRDIKLIQDPVAFDDVVTSDEDATVTLDVLSNDLLGGGVTNNAAQISIVSQPAHGNITIIADGTVSYVPAAHFYGTDSFTYTTTVDGRVSNQATVSLKVRHVNHAPVVSTDNVAMTVTAGKAVEIKPLTLSQASDIDGDVLHAAITTQPAHGTVVVNADGSWTYTADADYAGTDSLSFHVVDTNTDGSGINASSAIVTVHFTVEPANTAPVANNVHLTLLEDGSININFADAASGLGTDAEGDALIATITAQPIHGSLTHNADGTYTYVPTQYFHGDDAIRFTLNDGKLNSQEATISLHVTHVNHAATVSNSIVALDEDSRVNINWTSTANDVDGDTLTARIVSQAAHGTVVINADGTFTYTANANYNGTDSFFYVVNDGSVDSKVAKVSVSPAI